MTSDKKAALRKKRVWKVSDFAAWVEISHKSAKSVLLCLDAELGGLLLRQSSGTNRGYWFFPAMLAKAKPELFEHIESLEQRLDDLEDAFSTMKTDQKRIVSQVGQNSRDVDRLKRTRRAA